MFFKIIFWHFFNDIFLYKVGAKLLILNFNPQHWFFAEAYSTRDVNDPTYNSFDIETIYFILLFKMIRHKKKFLLINIWAVFVQGRNKKLLGSITKKCFFDNPNPYIYVCYFTWPYDWKFSRRPLGPGPHREVDRCWADERMCAACWPEMITRHYSSGQSAR